MSNYAQTRFWYGTDGQRYRKEVGGVVNLYLGNVEPLIEGGVTTFRRYGGGVVIQTLGADMAPTTKYLFHARLGSMLRVVNGRQHGRRAGLRGLGPAPQLQSPHATSG